MATTNIYYTVVRGDNLTKIARKYGTTWQQIYSWNRSTIGSNPNLIYPGQRLIVGSQTTSSGGGGTTTSNTAATASPPVVTNAGKVTITAFGPMTDNDSTCFVKWAWNRDNTEKYEIEWQYYTRDSQWFIGTHTTTTYKESTYSIPSYAKAVCVFIKPISYTRKVNNQDYAYWTANWTDAKIYNVKEKEPDLKTPSTPTVKLERFTLSLDLDNLDENAEYVQFEIVKDDSTTYKTATVQIRKQAASYSCSISAGYRYKVRARVKKGSKYSEWSNYSDDKETIPLAPSGFTSVTAMAADQIKLTWNKVNNATGYEIEYALDDKKYFDTSNQTTKVTVENVNTWLLTGLTSGHIYYLRLRAKNETGESEWSGIKQCVIGSTPSAPTTWSSTNSVIVGEKLYLYWVHNCEDGSTEKAAKLRIWVDGVLTISDKVINNPNYYDNDHKDDTRSFEINTKDILYKAGGKIEWQVQTAGITMQWGDWSTLRTINIYARPTLELHIHAEETSREDLFTITSFPFWIYGLAGPSTQTPNSYHISIIANSSYETTDRIGNTIMINKGDEVFSKYYDSNNKILNEKMTPYMMDLQSGVEYTLKCIVSMDSGLTAEESFIFDVSWTDIAYMPSAEISFDKDTLVTYIRPYCTHTPIKRKMLVKKIDSEHEYVPVALTSQNADDVINAQIEPDAYYKDVENPYTFTDPETNESETDNRIYAVYKGTNAAGTVKYYYEYIGDEELVDNITLSVYRREFDGSFVEIGTELLNQKNTFVTDPHPPLDYARYRIIAIDNATGAISFSDTGAYPTQEKAVIIQWDEEWSNFDITDENGDPFKEKPWTGSMLRLPYNIDTSHKHTYDVELVSYAGRKHPVSYYGTQVGENATWNLEIPADDKETLYGIRRLAIWTGGDVYVREPSGTGYWAAINVSYSKTHNEVVIPITFDIVRVEGGM